MDGKLAATVEGVIDAREVADGAAFYVGLGYSDAANKDNAVRMIGNYGNLQFSATSAQGTQSELTSQVAAFEALLQGGKLYTNASAAYAAYVQANRLLDAARYGGADVSAARLKAATDALIAGMAAMQEYTRPQMGKATLAPRRPLMATPMCCTAPRIMCIAARPPLTATRASVM